MVERTRRLDPTDTSDWQDVLDQLNAVRLTNDWSYRQLADDIKRVSTFDISAQTLQPMLAPPRAQRAKPYDRTIFKIRQYLELARTGRKAAAR